MIEPIDMKLVQRLVDICGRPLLPGVRDPLQPGGAGGGEDARELARRVADLGRVEPDRLDPIEPRLGCGERRQRIGLVEMTQEAEDQLGGDTELRIGRRDAGEEAVRHHLKRNAARGVGLRIEHDLGMNDPIGMRAGEVGEREIVEILLGLQHVGTLIIDIEEVLQVGKAVSRTHLLNRSEGNRDAISPREREHLFRLETAFDMQVQLGLGQAGQEGVEIAHKTNPSDRRRAAYSLLLLPLLLAARGPAPKGELVLDAARPVIAVRIEGVALQLRVDPGQWQVIELNSDAVARLPLTFEEGHDVEVGTIILPGRVAAGRLDVAGVRRPVTLATHAVAPATDADGTIGPDLLPYAIIRWRRADALPPTDRRTLAVDYDSGTGFAALDGSIPLHFTLALPTSFATGAAGSALARDRGGNFNGPAAPIAVPFSQTRLARPLELARPALLAGFRFASMPVRISDYRGKNPLPADPVAPDDIVVSHRVRPQPAQSWVTIAADRLSHCAEIVYTAVPRTLTLACAFDRQ